MCNEPRGIRIGFLHNHTHSYISNAAKDQAER